MSRARVRSGPLRPAGCAGAPVDAPSSGCATPAEHDLRRDRLDRAAEGFQSLLRIDRAGRRGACAGMDRVAEPGHARAERQASDFRFKDAEAALGRARDAARRTSAAVARRRTRDRARATAQEPPATSPASPARAPAARARACFREAAAAQARGDLLAPPGDSAFDKLRAARALDPADPAVRRASAQLLPAARECFERGLRTNDLASRPRLPGCARHAGRRRRAPSRRRARAWRNAGSRLARSACAQAMCTGARRALDTARARSTPERRESMISPSGIAIASAGHALTRSRSRRGTAARTVSRALSSEKCRRRCPGPHRAVAVHSAASACSRTTARRSVLASSATSTSRHRRRCMPSTAHDVATTGCPCAMLRLTLPLTPAP